MGGFSGGCLCGSVRYEVKSDPVRMLNCHCNDCRRNTGAAFATNIFVNAEDVQILKGTMSQFEHTADSGVVRIKEFCVNCGSQLFGHVPSLPGMKTIKVGSIDDANFVAPTANLFISRALSYSHISDELENFDRMPDG